MSGTGKHTAGSPAGRAVRISLLGAMVVAQLPGHLLARGYGSGSLGAAIRGGTWQRSVGASPFGGPSFNQRLAISTTRAPFINMASPAGVSMAPAATIGFGGPGLQLYLTPGVATGPAAAAPPGRFTYQGSGAGASPARTLPPVTPGELLKDLSRQLPPDQPPPFSPEWYQHNILAWRPGDEAFSPWSQTPWVAIAKWTGVAEQPIAYDYVSDSWRVLHVFRNNERVGLAVESRQGAEEIARAAQREVASSQWVSLGAFAVISPESGETESLLQLCISTTGLLRGSACGLADGQAGQVHGSLDKTSQRVAWIMDPDEAVMEAGLSSFTGEGFRCLRHGEDGWTRIRLVVRVDEAAMTGGEAAEDDPFAER